MQYFLTFKCCQLYEASKETTAQQNQGGGAGAPQPFSGNQGGVGGVVVGGAPMTHVNGPSLSTIRNEVIKIAKSYVRQAEVPGFDSCNSVKQ